MNTNSHDDDTLREILMEDEKEVSKSIRKKSCLVRILFLLIFLLVTILGFIFIQQYLLDLEAEAIVRAARTATAVEKSMTEMTEETSDIQQQETGEPIETPSPLPTQDPVLNRTATIAVQLTDVAAFQVTATAEP